MKTTRHTSSEKRTIVAPSLIVLFIVILLWIFVGQKSFAQGVGISEVTITPDASSILELRSTLRGLLTPRMTTAERNAILSPATGLLIYNTTTNAFNYYNGGWIAILNFGTGLTSINGTLNRISIGGTPTVPIIDIDANYPGQTTITTLGLINTGIWNSTAIGIAYGGTGATDATGSRSNLGLGNVNNTSDANKPVSTATQSALNLKEDLADKSIDVSADGTSDLKYPSVKATKTYVDAAITTATPDATTLVKGKVKLAGDLSGTADLPTVAAVGGSTAANINSAAILSNAATNSNTASTIVRRDGSGNFAAGTITANLSGNAATATTATNLSGGSIGLLPYQSATNTTALLAVGSVGQVLQSNGAAAPSWVTPNTGTVTSVSVVSANGFTGSVATASTTPAITLTSSVSGILKGNGTAISAALAGTDYVAPNVTIAGATKTKITYDAKGLVTTGADATTSDISPSANRNYVTDAQQIVISNTSGTNTGDQTNISGNAGTATALSAARSIYGNSFDGTANLNQVIASTYGGTGNGFTKFTGPITAERTFTLPNASATILTSNAAVTVAQGGTGLTTGIQGGIPYFSSSSGMTSSALLTQNGIIIGGGSGSAPSSIGVGATNTVLHGNTGAAPSFSAVNLTTDVTGILPVANGGTGSSSGNFWNLTGNSGTTGTAGTNFVGTTDGQDLVFKANNIERARIDNTNGDMKIGDANTGTIKATKELVLREDGDVYGSSYLILRNRNTENGAIFYNPHATTTLVDFIFRTSVDQRNIRYEARAFMAKTGTPSFHIGGASPDAPTLSIGDSYAAFNKGVRIGTYPSGTVPVPPPTALLHLDPGTSAAGTAPLKFTSGPYLSTAEAGAVEYNGTNFYVTDATGTRYILAKTLTGSATLDFPSTAANASSDLFITVTGASVGDVVVLGIPGTSNNANSNYSTWVSAANTVTVRFNNYSSGVIDPVSGLYRVSVLKY